MGSRQIVLVSTARFSVLNTGIFWREAKTKRLFSQCAAQEYFLRLFGIESQHDYDRTEKSYNFYPMDGESVGLTTLVFSVLNAHPGLRAGILNISRLVPTLINVQMPQFLLIKMLIKWVKHKLWICA
jgi:hypothetical protein